MDSMFFNEEEILLQNIRTEISMQDFLRHFSGGACVFYFRHDTWKQPQPVYINDGFCRILGYTCAELSQHFKQDPLFTVDKKNIRKVIRAQKKFLVDQIPYSLVYQSKRKDGQDIWLSVHASGQKRADGSILQYIIITDLTNYYLEEQTYKQLSLHQMMNYGGFFTVAVDKSLTLIYSNEKFYQIHQHTRESFEQMFHNQYASCIFERDRVQLQARMQEALLQKKSGLEWEMRVLSGEENVKYVLASGAFRYDANHWVLSGVAIDITERKEAQLRYESQVKLFSELNPDSVGSFRLNLTKNCCGDGHSIYPEILELQSEGTVDSFLDKVYKKSIGYVDVEAFRMTFRREMLLNAYSRGETIITREHLYTISGDVPKWIHTKILMTKNPSTGDIEALITSNNIHKEKISQILIQHSTQFDYDQFVYIDAKTDYFLSYSNKRNRSFLLPEKGTNFSDANSQRIKACISLENQQQMIHQMLLPYVCNQLKDKEEYLIYCDVKLKDGQFAKKKFHFSYISRETSELILRESDITHYHQEEEEKKRLIREALAATEQANAAKSEFLSRMSHEIRAPLNAIIGMAGIARMSGGNIDKIMDCIFKIDVSSRYLLGIINDILDMSRIESGKVVLEQDAIYLHNLIRRVNDICLPQAKVKSIVYSYTIDEAVAACYIGDETKLQQVMINILSNAIKFTDSRGRIRLHVSVSKKTKEYDVLQFKIRDTGRGIDESFISKIFEPFEQEGIGTLDFGRGTGLGLSICRHFVKLMGGRIEVQSEKDIGTEFIVYVPLPVSCSNPSGLNQIGNAVDGCEWLKGSKVLLVEDQILNIEIATELLTMKGILVDYVKNGVQAIHKFSTAPDQYDLILMDIQMPIMDGLKATEEIRALPIEKAKTIPIIAMTANAFDKDIEKSREVGMNAHLTKPIEPEILYTTLAEYLRYKQ